MEVDSESSELCTHVDCTPIFLPILLGVLLSTVGLGVILVSSARYLSRSPDRRYRKKRAVVVVVTVVQAVQTSFDVARVLEIFAIHYGDLRCFLRPRWFHALAPIFAVLIQVQTQFFLLARAYASASVAQVGKWSKWVGTGMFAAGILGSGACALVTSLQINLRTFPPGYPKTSLSRISAPGWLISSAFIDFTFSIIIALELLAARQATSACSASRSQRMLDVPRYLVPVVLRSGVCLAVAQTATAIVWLVEAHTARDRLSSAWLCLPMIVLPTLYTLTYLSILRAPGRNLQRNDGSSRASSSTLLLTTATPAGPGGEPREWQLYLPRLNATRRRAFPPSSIDSTDPYSHCPPYDPSACCAQSPFLDPLASMPLNASPASPSYRLPLHFVPDPSRSAAITTSERGSEAIGHACGPRELTQDDPPDSPRSRRSPWSTTSSAPFFPVPAASASRSMRVSTTIRPEPLQLAPYAYGVMGSRSVTEGGAPSSVSSNSYPPPHPYQQRSPAVDQPFPSEFVPVSAISPLPLSPPPSPKSSTERLVDGHEGPKPSGGQGWSDGAAGGEHHHFAYGTTSSILPSFQFSPEPNSPSSSSLTSGGDTAPRASMLHSRRSEGRMFLPHPPLSTVDEGSTPPRSARWPEEWRGAGGSGRASWIPLALRQGEGQVDAGQGSGEEAELVFAAHAPSPEPSSGDSPYIFPPCSSARAPRTPSSPSHLRPLLLVPSSSTLGTPPRSPRLIERRGAVDLLLARPGVPLRMEPLEGERPEEGEWQAWPEMRPVMGRARELGPQSEVSGGSESKREHGFWDRLGGSASVRFHRLHSFSSSPIAHKTNIGVVPRPQPPHSLPRRIFSHFSSPSTTTLSTFSSSSYSSPSITAPIALHSAPPGPTIAASEQKKRGMQLADSLRSPPNLAASPVPDFPPISSSSSASAHPPPADSRPHTLPPPARTKRPTHQRSQRSWSERLHLARSTSFGCKDAHAFDRGEISAVTVQTWETREGEEVEVVGEGGSGYEGEGDVEKSLAMSGTSSGAGTGTWAW
ncbi:hypothetical protein JCM11251_001866 [Rhodosporidiobolus azoricus]